MNTIAILAFIISVVIILILSKKSITIGIFAASIFLGIVTIPLELLFFYLYSTFFNIEYLLLATAVGIIPIIGGLLNKTGMLDEMIKNYKFSKKTLLIFSPAVLGLLPMPGGALFSAPMVEKTTDEVSSIRKASINEWFRHIFHLIYPLATALIIGAELAGLATYIAAAFVFPAFLVSLVLGVFLLLKNVKDGTKAKNISIAKFLKPLLVLLLAPIIDITLKIIFNIKYLATFIGVTVSLLLLILFTKVDTKTFTEVFKSSKPWDFFFLIIAIFLYQNIFINSGVPNIFRETSFSPYLILIVASFALGVLTGRLSTPLVILIPIYIIKFGTMSPLNFAILYYSTMMGYIISPVHPCLVFTAQYFRVDVKDVMKDLSLVTFASLLLGVSFLELIYFLNI
ncbi:MAG: DUF401 family protein [Candidatus Asgardarchaeum sp.]